MIHARMLHPGEARGRVLVLDEPLSFWGGFDPKTGKIIDVHHPQHGENLAGAVVLLPESRGSGTAPGAVAEATRRGTGPQAIITIIPDVNLAIGALVAETLYGKTCAVLSVDAADYMYLTMQSQLAISANGIVTAAY